MVYRGFEDIAGNLQGQLENFTDNLYSQNRRRNSPRAQNRRRGGQPGENVPAGYREGRLQNFTPEQMQLLEQMLGNVGTDSYLQRLAGGDEELYNEMEAPALRQFNELQGNLASRFGGMGTGAINSSGFQNAARQQSSDFAQQLQANRQGLQRQAIKDLQSISSELLGQRPYEKFLVQKQQPQQKPYEPSGFEQVLGGVGSFLGGASQGFGNYFGKKLLG